MGVTVGSNTKADLTTDLSVNTCPVDHSVAKTNTLAYAAQSSAYNGSPFLYNAITSQLSCSIRLQIGNGWVAHSATDHESEVEQQKNFTSLSVMFANAAQIINPGDCVTQNFPLDSFTGVTSGQLEICKTAKAELYFQNLKMGL